MANNFYVGEVYHKRKILKFNFDYREKLVLYTEDDIIYLDLLGEKAYTCDRTHNDYVIRESLIPTDVRDYKVDYMYLLNNGDNKRRIKNKVL